MSRTLRLVTLIMAFFEGFGMAQVNKVQKKVITSVFFPTDNGRWTDLIMSSFTSKLAETGLPFDFVTRSWEPKYSRDELILKIVSDSPDVVFLPDDFLYKVLAKEIQEKTGALILFVTFYTNKSDLNVVSNQAGVFCDAPVDHLIKTAQKISTVKTVGVIGGPFSGEMTNRIKEKAGQDVKIEYHATSSWDEYVETLQNFGSKYDAVWPLAPFGVKHQDGTWVQDFQLNSLINAISKPALGYGMISKLERTIDMEIDPRILGENAAHAAFKYFRTGEKDVTTFTSYSIRINDKHMQRLGLTVPEDLSGFLVLRD